MKDWQKGYEIEYLKKIKEEFSYKFEDTFKSKEKTIKFIDELKKYILDFNKKQKQGKVI